MASHGRRHASARTIERKKAKKAMKQANTRMRKIGNSKFGTNHNPAIDAYRRAGKPKQFFKFEKGMNKFQQNRVTKEATKFLHSKTSTKAGAKKVLRQTVKNILGGGSNMSENDIQKYNDFNVLIENPELGESLIAQYFNVYYKVKDLLSSSHVYVPSDDIMKTITTEIEDRKSIIKNMTHTSNITLKSNGITSIEFKFYLDLMNSAELAQKVVDDLI